MRYTILILTGMLNVAGCDSQTDAYPRLLPTDQVLAEPALPEHSAEAATSPAAVDADATARAEALRKRAEALRGPVIESDLRSRMESAGP